MRNILIEMKGGSCEKCGYNKCVSALDFHHKNPNEKDFGLSSNGNTQSWKKLTQEADKCLLLCANCHRELHEELNGYKESRINIKQKTYKKVNSESSISRKEQTKQYNKCIICNSDTYNKKYCSYTCTNLNKRKVKERPTKEELIELLIRHNWTQAAAIFDVTDNAVRKWAKEYGINTNRKELKLGT